MSFGTSCGQELEKRASAYLGSSVHSLLFLFKQSLNSFQAKRLRYMSERKDSMKFAVCYSTLLRVAILSPTDT